MDGNCAMYFGYLSSASSSWPWATCASPVRTKPWARLGWQLTNSDATYRGKYRLRCISVEVGIFLGIPHSVEFCYTMVNSRNNWNPCVLYFFSHTLNAWSICPLFRHARPFRATKSGSFSASGILGKRNNNKKKHVNFRNNLFTTQFLDQEDIARKCLNSEIIVSDTICALLIVPGSTLHTSIFIYTARNVQSQQQVGAEEFICHSGSPVWTSPEPVQLLPRLHSWLRLPAASWAAWTSAPCFQTGKLQGLTEPHTHTHTRKISIVFPVYVSNILTKMWEEKTVRSHCCQYFSIFTLCISFLLYLRLIICIYS